MIVSNERFCNPRDIRRGALNPHPAFDGESDDCGIYYCMYGELCAIGIHGQYIYINTAKEVVISKFSCQPKADDDELDRKTLDFFRGVSSSL
jgi:hypothetical protein